MTFAQCRFTGQQPLGAPAHRPDCKQRVAYLSSLPSETTELNKLTQTYPGARALAVLSLTAVLMLASACASTPPAPVAALDAAKVAISNAERADAGHFAGPELDARSLRWLTPP